MAKACMVIAGLASVACMGWCLVYWFMHPALTSMQLTQAMWPWLLAGVLNVGLASLMARLDPG